MVHELPKLNYGFDALEPHISKEIMEIHVTKHHQTYINNLNAAEKDLAAAVQANDVRKQIALQSALKFNGGGHINHTQFWNILAPTSAGGGKLESGSSLAKAIEKDFGSVDELIKQANAAALGIQGSGWTWIGYDAKKDRLEITTTANQDPLTTHALIIGIDLWEHAYYLQYQNLKPKYLEAIWKVLNWPEAIKRYDQAKSGAKL